METNSINILIVDDEPIVIDAIKSGVDWTELDEVRVLSAYNVFDAQDVMRKNSVGVVLCDIEMPEATGLDMIKWVNDNYPVTVCIFLTCHAEFTYAKQAVAMKVFDYLLKPIAYRELTEVLKKAIAHHKELMSGEKAMVLLANLSQNVKEEEPSKTAMIQIVEEVKAYVLSNISDESLNCDAIAQHVFLNSDYLSRVFKTQTGISLKSFIINSRMTLACELLTKTNLSVTQIALSCGYIHMAHFSKMFKQKNDLTPCEYRDKYK